MGLHQNGSHTSFKRPLCRGNGGHYRKPQLDTMQRSKDYGDPSPSRYICSIAPSSMPQGRSCNRGGKTVKVRISGSLL